MILNLNRKVRIGLTDFGREVIRKELAELPFEMDTELAE